MGWSNKDKAHGRNYKAEYEKYQGSDLQKKHRAERNKARAQMEKAGLPAGHPRSAVFASLYVRLAHLLRHLGISTTRCTRSLIPLN